ncbi:MAG: hypothetical protein AAGB35_06305 [Pseudomonadota bacterium]
MKKLFLLIFAGFVASASLANASSVKEYYDNDGYTKWQISNVMKRGNEHHLGGLPGVKLLETDTFGTFYKERDGKKAGYTAQLEGGWKVDIHMHMWGKDSDNWDEFVGKARCTGNSDCDISDWKYLTQNYEHESKIFRGDEVYIIDDFWGQVGYNAGGVHVSPNDGGAWGGWFELWEKVVNPTFATADVICLEDTRDGCGVDKTWHGHADINGNKVPLPAAWIFFSFGLVGLRALGIIRKKDA